jgi:hypothetical protein
LPSDQLVLAFDTSAAHCAAALLSGDRVLGIRTETMLRGQAERLMPLLEEVLAEAGLTWRDLTLIGVGVGPGNFTGVRIAVAAARGLALGLGIPARGISGFAATRLHGRLAATSPVALPAPQAQVWLDDGAAAPRLTTSAIATDLCATGAPAPEALAVAIARAAARGDGMAPPVPLYLRAADAAPASDLPPVILDA